MSAPKTTEPLCPPELSDGLPEGLTTALIASDFSVDEVIDQYLKTISDKTEEIWQQADRHAFVLTHLLLAEYHYRIAVEQLLKSRIRHRLHATGR